MKLSLAAVCLALGGVLSGCGGGNAGASAEPGVPVTSTTQTLDASGGTVTLQGLSLAVPAAALAASTELGLQQETVARPALARFRFSPAGQALGKPAELRYSAPGLPANVRFFWEVDGEQWMIPGTVSGGVLTSQATSLGYNAAGTVVLQAQAKAQAASLTERLTAARARVLPQADSASEGGGLVVAPVDCDSHVSELSARLRRAATDGDQDRAAGIYNDLVATQEACADVRAQELEQASCDALAQAQSNASVLLADSLLTFRSLTVPLMAAEGFVENTGATCSNANPAANLALMAAKFDQLLDVMKGQMARAEFDDALTVRDLDTVMHLDTLCQKLDLGALCDRLNNELYPDLLDALRTSAFEACRTNGRPLEVSQFYALGSRAGIEEKFYDHGRFSLAAVEADLNYCSNPSLGLRVFDGEAVPSELTDRATALRPLVALGNYAKQKTIEVPRDGSLNIAGTVGVLRCPDGSASGANLVVRINGQEWVRRAASGDGYPLESAPLLLDLPKVLPVVGIDPETSTGFTVTVNREGGACSDGKQAVLDAPFTLFEVQVGLPTVPSGRVWRRQIRLQTDYGFPNVRVVELSDLSIGTPYIKTLAAGDAAGYGRSSSTTDAVTEQGGTLAGRIECGTQVGARGVALSYSAFADIETQKQTTLTVSGFGNGVSGASYYLVSDYPTFSSSIRLFRDPDTDAFLGAAPIRLVLEPGRHRVDFYLFAGYCQPGTSLDLAAGVHFSLAP